MSAVPMTLPEIRQRGHAALLRELGPVGYVRFLQQLVPGRGDYTRDRGKVIAAVNLDDIKRRVKSAGGAKAMKAGTKRRRMRKG
jgi:hypothetical protein